MRKTSKTTNTDKPTEHTQNTEDKMEQTARLTSSIPTSQGNREKKYINYLNVIACLLHRYVSDMQKKENNYIHIGIPRLSCTILRHLVLILRSRFY